MSAPILCLQPDIVWEDKPANFAAVRAMLEAAEPAAGTLVALPEMFATGFSMDVAGIAEGAVSESGAFLSETAREFGVWIVGGLVTALPDGRGRNEAVVVDPTGEEVARYAKIHPFSYGREGERYSAGDAIETFDWQGCTVAPFVCYDLRFPEIFRLAVQRGAQLFTVIANWPTVREPYWLALLKARAIENQAWVAGVNRVGSDPNAAYGGRSLIIDPKGEVVADAGSAPGAISATIDPAVADSWRAEFPALRDIRCAIALDPSARISSALGKPGG